MALKSTNKESSKKMKPLLISLKVFSRLRGRKTDFLKDEIQAGRLGLMTCVTNVEN